MDKMDGVGPNATTEEKHAKLVSIVGMLQAERKKMID